MAHLLKKEERLAPMVANHSIFSISWSYGSLALAKDAEQCDQIDKLFFNIWPFAVMKISTIMSQICKSMLSILPNKK